MSQEKTLAVELAVAVIETQAPLYEAINRVRVELSELLNRVDDLEAAGDPSDEYFDGAVIEHEETEIKSMSSGGGVVYHRYPMPRQGWWLVVVDHEGAELGFRVQHDDGRQIVLQVVGETRL